VTPASIALLIMPVLPVNALPEAGLPADGIPGHDHPAYCLPEVDLPTGGFPDDSLTEECPAEDDLPESCPPKDALPPGVFMTSSLFHPEYCIHNCCQSDLNLNFDLLRLFFRTTFKMKPDE
jgi:hypothetical protein